MARKPGLVLMAVILTVAAIELLSFAGVAVVRRILPRLVWWPNVARFEAGYQQFLAVHDPLLGWPSTSSRSGRARRSPTFPDTIPSCVALFGDSFTYGSEVDDDAAWGNVLAPRLHCRVANWGVPSYGTDQAFLRYRDRANEHAPVVILGIYQDNIQRNVNRFRELLAGGQSFGFKPRFRLGDQGRLELVPLAPPDPRDARTFIESPERFLSDEYFLPGSSGGPVRLTLPFTLSLLRLLFHPDVRAVLGGHPYWERFYRPEHESGALETTVAIVRAFHDEADSRAQRLMVFLFPSSKTMRKFRAPATRPYHNLIDRITAEGIPVVDLADGIMARLAGRSPCEIAARPGCSGHYNAEGNRWVAEIAQEALAQKGWLPTAAK